jgi:proteasome assembly chaperone 3
MATLDDVLQQSLNLNLPFPAATKQAAGLVDGVKTDVMVMNFSDKIMVTISQQGRLAHWVCLAESAGEEIC